MTKPQNFRDHRRKSRTRVAELNFQVSRRCSSLAGPVAAPPTLTRWQKLELNKRLSKLRTFAHFKSQGATDLEAARQARINPVTLWRWQRRIQPLGLDGLVPFTHKCGRVSIFEKLRITPEHIAAVQRLQFGGLGNCAAWHLFARHAHCPPALAIFLRGAKSIPPSLLRASKVARRKVLVAEIVAGGMQIQIRKPTQ